MANDPVLLAAGLKPPGHPDAFAQMGDVVWKVVAEDDVVSGGTTLSSCYIALIPLSTGQLFCLVAAHAHNFSPRKQL